MPDPAAQEPDLSRWTLPRLATLARSAATASVLLAVLGQAASLLLPAASGHAIDSVYDGRGTLAATAALVALLVARVLAESLGAIANVSTTTRILVRLRYRLLRQILALGVPGLRRYSTGDLMTRLVGNAGTAANAVSLLAMAAAASAASLVGLVALGLIDWWLAVAFLVGVLPVGLLARRLVTQAVGRYGEYLEHLAAIAARLTDALTGARTIRASGTAEREVRRILAPLPDLSRAGMATWAVQRAVSWQVEAALVVVQVLVLAVAGTGVATGRVSPGDVLAASLYLAIALNLLGQLDVVMQVTDARANATRVFEVLHEPAPTPATGTVRAGYAAGPARLSFRGVRVRIGDRVVLDGVDLEVPAGLAVAVVGASGSGKSTLALLAGRLIDPDEGEVLVDSPPGPAPTPGLAPAPAAPAARGEVSYAFDRPVLVGDTVRDALSYGRPGATDAQVRRALRIADAEDFVRRLPGGWHTALPDAPLSGGEIQRLGLARAAVHMGRILVLDDATSSLDTVTEAKVTRALTEGLAGTTRLVVAHRAATAAACDAVAWLDGGRIRALAPHHDLWAAEPAYRAVFAVSAGSDPEHVHGDLR